MSKSYKIEPGVSFITFFEVQCMRCPPRISTCLIRIYTFITYQNVPDMTFFEAKITEDMIAVSVQGPFMGHPSHRNASQCTDGIEVPSSDTTKQAICSLLPQTSSISKNSFVVYIINLLHLVK